MSEDERRVIGTLLDLTDRIQFRLRMTPDKGGPIGKEVHALFHQGEILARALKERE